LGSDKKKTGQGLGASYEEGGDPFFSTRRLMFGGPPSLDNKSDKVTYGPHGEVMKEGEGGSELKRENRQAGGDAGWGCSGQYISDSISDVLKNAGGRELKAVE